MIVSEMAKLPENHVAHLLPLELMVQEQGSLCCCDREGRDHHPGGVLLAKLLLVCFPPLAVVADVAFAGHIWARTLSPTASELVGVS